jgi:hypothetical protein
MSCRSSPTLELTRHFFRDFFYLGFLTDAGADSFTRLMISILAGLMSLGIFLPMIFFQKYTSLAMLTDPEPYRRALLGDQLFMLCVAMFIIALIGTVISQSIFPSETDFRVLTPLPVTRRAIFGAKLLALTIVATVFIIATNVATGPVFPAVSGGRWAQEPLLSRITAHTVACLLASIFALASVLSVQGFIAVLVPRKWLRPASATAQTVTACGLVLCLPFIIRASAQSTSIESHANWWYALPPAWFLGLEQVLLGNGHVYFLRLASIGLASLVFCVMSIGVCYVILFRRFDRIMLRPSYVPSRTRSEWLPRLTLLGKLHPAEAAVVEFLVAGLRRSRLHQLVFWGTSAVALAIAIHSLVDVGIGEVWVGEGALSREALLTAAWTPLLVVFVAVRALRDTLMLPLEIRASWIFRVTEDGAVRPRQLDAVRRVVFALGVVPAVTLFFPVHISAGGVQRATCWAVLTLLMGRLLVDWTLTGWRSIPFTCAYAPGKRHIVPTILLTLIAFLAFVGTGTVALHSGTASPSAFLAWLGIFGGTIAYARGYRRRTWGRLPLEFDDVPDGVQLLRLSGR